MDVIKHKWWYIAAIIILASVLVVLKKPYLPVGCQSGQRAPEVRFVYPPPTNPTNLLPSLLKEAGVYVFIIIIECVTKNHRKLISPVSVGLVS